jgi:hypothetical protein
MWWRPSLTYIPLRCQSCLCIEKVMWLSPFLTTYQTAIILFTHINLNLKKKRKTKQNKTYRYKDGLSKPDSWCFIKSIVGHFPVVKKGDRLINIWKLFLSNMSLLVKKSNIFMEWWCHRSQNEQACKLYKGNNFWIYSTIVQSELYILDTVIWLDGTDGNKNRIKFLCCCTKHKPRKHCSFGVKHTRPLLTNGWHFYINYTFEIILHFSCKNSRLWRKHVICIVILEPY